MNDTVLQELLDDARQDIEEISVQDAYRLYKSNEDVVFLDIREPEHFALGYIEGSIFIRGDELEMQARHLIPDKDIQAVLYCGTGVRSVFTAVSLKELGYSNVKTMRGGIEAWIAAGYEVKTEGVLSLEQLTRYSRQIIVPEIGVEGQKKLLDARVLMVGAGGLGSSAGLYLASAGIGTIGIVDFDRVDKSNLNRQIIHTYTDIGRPKVESATETIHRLNPEVKVVSFKEKLTADTASDIMKDFDLVLDGSDNLPTKYLLNDAAYFAGIPFVFGAALQFDGHASVFYPKGGGPCLRCMRPTLPRAELVPT